MTEEFEELRRRYEDEEVLAVFEARATQCTGQARLVRRIEGERARLHGFTNRENPGTIVDGWDEPDEGHDFAVVDERYIVDPWMFHMSLDGQDIRRAIFDLEAKHDAAIITACYGDRGTWRRFEEMEAAADRESLPDGVAQLVQGSGARMR